MSMVVEAIPVDPVGQRQIVDEIIAGDVQRSMRHPQILRALVTDDSFGVFQAHI
jgi:hypothetical protein